MELGKVTEKGRRRYDDACATAHALDLVGDRWALPVIREMMFGPRRFSDLRAALPGISANVLTQRLEELEAAGVVVRRRLPPPASVQVYDLTDWGRELEPVFQVLGRWGARSPRHDPTLPISVNSVLMSFRTMYDPARAAGLVGRTVGLAFGEETFAATFGEAELTVRRAPAEGDVVFTGEARALAGAVYGGVPLAALEAAGALRVSGDRDLAQRFLGLFPLPEKVVVAET